MNAWLEDDGKREQPVTVRKTTSATFERILQQIECGSEGGDTGYR